VEEFCPSFTVAFTFKTPIVPRRSLVAEAKPKSLDTELNNFNQTPTEVFSNVFEGTEEIAQMLAYFEAHTYIHGREF
jgi:hypothetical protein